MKIEFNQFINHYKFDKHVDKLANDTHKNIYHFKFLDNTLHLEMKSNVKKLEMHKIMQ